MAPATTVHLPNGHNLTVSPVFGGLFFKPNEWSSNQSHFPAGWTVVLNSEDHSDETLPYAAQDAQVSDAPNNGSDSEQHDRSRRNVHRFRKPTLQGDHLYISSISNPNSSDFKLSSSPTRQIAMMLWATLWWYFHQPEPDTRVTTAQSSKTVDDGKPRGEWRIRINREGIFKGRTVMPKLERMGLIATENSCVGVDPDDRHGEGWTDMFVSRRAFWQLDARIYLFTLSPLSASPYPSSSPYASRPASPTGTHEHRREASTELASPAGLWTPAQGPFHSSSHMPTYYPPPPTQYIMTNGIRHPMRPKPPRQGETFYTRYIPSVGQYLSFRVASLSPKATVHRGPVAGGQSGLRVSQHNTNLEAAGGGLHALTILAGAGGLEGNSDVDLLHKWMNEPRVSQSWGEDGPKTHQEAFLKAGLKSRHSFPVIGCWDGRPFGYFEIYWVQEDRLGRLLCGDVGSFDRGLHCLVGEQEFRGTHRVKLWLSALVHWCWLNDSRTETVMLEPRVDNVKFKHYLEDVGFYKEREVSFPHKQSNLMKIRRDAWEAPAL